MRILLVEDDVKIAKFIVKGLKQVGFVVEHATDGEDGFYMATTLQYDAAIIDIMLPRLDGLSLIEQLRDARISMPVLVLSAKRSVDDRVKGLETGGDDYLTKPFAFAELVARLQALIRRSRGSPEITTLSIGDLSIDLLTREVTRAGEKIELQPKEFAVLEYLMRNAGRIVSKNMLIGHVWGYDFDPGTNAVEVCICKLRDKIDQDFEPKLLRTIRGVGYVLKGET